MRGSVVAPCLLMCGFPLPWLLLLSLEVPCLLAVPTTTHSAQQGYARAHSHRASSSGAQPCFPFLGQSWLVPISVPCCASLLLCHPITVPSWITPLTCLWFAFRAWRKALMRMCAR